MTAIKLEKPLSAELTELIGRLGLLVVVGDGLTAEEVRDLRAWLQAARSKHHAEMRECRGWRWQAAIVDFQQARGDGRQAAGSAPAPGGRHLL